MATAPTRTLDASELLHAAVSLVLKDEGFKLPTSPARSAVKTAEKLLEWSSGHKQAWKEFGTELLATLDSCFVDVISIQKFKKEREQMWAKFFQIRSSQPFIDRWNRFLGIADCNSLPVFYQFVTETLIDELVKLRYPIHTDVEDSNEVSLDYEERNAVRYTAGYTIRSLLKKVSNSTEKDELKKCLQEMTENTEESVHDSTDWTKAVDRGKLIHVDDNTFSLFAEMELILRKNLKSCKENLSEVGDIIVKDENVLFAWAIVSCNWQQEDSDLLRLIVNHWVTMRGHSNAKSLLEEYKRKSHQGIQKSKGLRKKIPTN